MERNQSCAVEAVFFIDIFDHQFFDNCFSLGHGTCNIHINQWGFKQCNKIYKYLMKLSWWSKLILNPPIYMNVPSEKLQPKIRIEVFERFNEKYNL